MNDVPPRLESVPTTAIMTLNFSSLVALTVVLALVQERPLQWAGQNLEDATWLRNYNREGMAQLTCHLYHGAPKSAAGKSSKGNKTQPRQSPEKAMGRSLYRVPKRYGQKPQQLELL